MGRLVKLNRLAEALKVHPRTILRHVKNDPNAYWAKGFDPDIDLDSVRLAFNIADISFVEKALAGEDSILTRKEASDLLGITEPAFRMKKYTSIIACGTILRFSKDDISSQHAAKYL